MKLHLLKFFMFICFLACAVKLGDFVISRIPPFSAGDCYYSEQYPTMVVKITKNHAIEGYSEVEVYMSERYKIQSAASFPYLKNDLKEKAVCP